MEKALLISLAITFFFLVAKLLESKYLDKTEIPFKKYIRDAVFVFIVSLICSYIFFSFEHEINDFFNVITMTGGAGVVGSAVVSVEQAKKPISSNTPIFEDNPF